MVKLSSRNILDILRRFEIANEDNVPRNIENVKISNPNPINTLASFRFNKHQFYILYDNSADDDEAYIRSQIETKKSVLSGKLLENPKDETTTYGMPFHNGSCYLFESIPEKKRLDSELAIRYSEISRSTWQKYIKAGYVKVNDMIIKFPRYDITEIDKIAVSIPEKGDYSKNELPILYIDDNVIVVNKPCGVLTHSKGALNDEFTVADYFRKYTTYNLDTNRPGIVHRLDRDTSGVIIGARNPETAEMLQKQFANRTTKKIYYAVLVGVPKLTKANIDLPIGRNPTSPSTFRVDSNGKPAYTKYEIIESTNKYSLVKLEPHTGRTHQLRVHMKYIGTPILGDKIYGKIADRLYLHAASLEITIPTSDRKVFYAPIPNELLKYFSKDIKL